MPTSNLARTLLVSAACATALWVAVQAAGPVKSQWLSRDMTVDGRLDEWGDLTLVEDGLAVAATNDADSLVVAVSTNHAATRAGLSRGLVLWFAPAGKQTMDFGVQLPATVDTQAGSGGRPLDPAALNDLDVLGPGKARRLVTLTPALGLQAASGTVGDTLAFELKLPLVASATHPRAVGVAAGRAFQLGIFTPESRTEDAREEVAAGPRTYGLGPVFGGPGTGIPLPDSSQKAPREEKPRTLKTWTTISLAAPPR